MTHMRGGWACPTLLNLGCQGEGGEKDRAGDPEKVSAEAPEPCLTELTWLGFLWAAGPLGRREQPFLKDAAGGGGGEPFTR